MLIIIFILTFIVFPIFLGYYAVLDWILILLSLALIIIGAELLKNTKKAILFCVCQIAACSLLYAYYIADNFIIKEGIVVYIIAAVIAAPVIYMIQNNTANKKKDGDKYE